jgi:adenosylcobyric acid synthase
LFGNAIKGYEIHYGRMGLYPLYYQSPQVCGTHVHGIFDDDAFRNGYFKAIKPNYQGYSYREYRESQIQQFADRIGKCIYIDALLENLQAG